MSRARARPEFEARSRASGRHSVGVRATIDYLSPSKGRTSMFACGAVARECTSLCIGETLHDSPFRPFPLLCVVSYRSGAPNQYSRTANNFRFRLIDHPLSNGCAFVTSNAVVFPTPLYIDHTRRFSSIPYANV